MPQWINTWNKRLSRLLWIVVLIGIVAALPVMYARVETEALLVSRSPLLWIIVTCCRLAARSRCRRLLYSRRF